MKVYQIYYNEETKAQLEPEYIPYFNNPTTVYFESKVMCDLIDKGEHKGVDYFGIVGNKLRRKISQSKTWGRRIRNISKKNFSPKSFEQFVYDYRPHIASYSTNGRHAVFPWAEQFHGGICKATQAIVKKLGIRAAYDKVTIQPIYFNYFVAKPDIYQDYVNKILRPAIDLMENDAEIKTLLEVDSNYGQVSAELEKQIGYNYYPLHPFICERLINLYLNMYNFKIIQW